MSEMDKNKVEAKKKTASKSKASATTIKVTLVKSLIGRLASHQASARGLGLRRINHSVEVIDTPANRGMVNKIAYLLKVEG